MPWWRVCVCASCVYSECTAIRKQNEIIEFMQWATHWIKMHRFRRPRNHPQPSRATFSSRRPVGQHIAVLKV